MFETVNWIFSVLIDLFQGYCLQSFYGSFLENRLPRRGQTALVVMALYAASRAVLSWIAPTKAWDYRAAVGKLLWSLCVLSILAVVFYKGFRRITVFLVAAFQAVVDISRYTAVILLGQMGDILLNLWNWCAGNGILTSEKAFGIAIPAGIIGEWLLEYLAIALLLSISLKKIARDFREKEYDMNRAELLFILTPAAVGLLICMLLRIIIVTVEGNVPEILYDRYPVLIVVLPAILFLSLLSILQGVKLFQDMIYRNREESGRMILEKEVEHLQKHIAEMERIYSGIGRMKHDMKNTLSIIQGLSAGDEAGKKEELRVYLSELNQMFEKLEVRFQTGNTVVDTLLNMKYYEAAREVPGLTLDAEALMLPQKLEIQSYDIGVILGNALDNALEACRRLREAQPQADAFIRLSSLQRGNLLIVKIENSFDGQLVRNGREIFPASAKADKKSHGIGLINIQKTAEKYQGAMDFQAEGRLFVLSVMMKNEKI